MAVGLVQGKALIDAFIAENKEDINCDIKEMTSATNSSGNSVSRLCNIINTTQNDIISSAVDKCWAPEVSGPSIEVFPAHNDEGIIITDIPVIEVPSITILDTPAIVEQPNNVEVFPEQRVETPIIIDFPAEKQSEKDNIIFIDGVGNTDSLFSQKALEHIFHGNINGKGLPSGYHHNNINSQAKLSNVSATDKFGVYKATIEIDGRTKFSTFFPESWDRIKVLKSIKEAHSTIKSNEAGWYTGTTNEGMKIKMWISDNGMIDTAFPIYSNK